MKKILSIILSIFVISCAFAQIADDGFVVPIHEDFTGNSSASTEEGTTVEGVHVNSS